MQPPLRLHIAVIRHAHRVARQQRLVALEQRDLVRARRIPADQCQVRRRVAAQQRVGAVEQHVAAVHVAARIAGHVCHVWRVEPPLHAAVSRLRLVADQAVRRPIQRVARRRLPRRVAQRRDRLPPAAIRIHAADQVRGRLDFGQALDDRDVRMAFRRHRVHARHAAHPARPRIMPQPQHHAAVRRAAEVLAGRLRHADQALQHRLPGGFQRNRVPAPGQQRHVIHQRIAVERGRIPDVQRQVVAPRGRRERHAPFRPRRPGDEAVRVEKASAVLPRVVRIVQRHADLPAPAVPARPIAQRVLRPRLDRGRLRQIRAAVGAARRQLDRRGPAVFRRRDRLDVGEMLRRLHGLPARPRIACRVVGRPGVRLKSAVEQQLRADQRPRVRRCVPVPRV